MKYINDFDVSQLIASFEYQHPLPEEMRPKERQLDLEAKLAFRREMNDWSRKNRIPLPCYK